MLTKEPEMLQPDGLNGALRGGRGRGREGKEREEKGKGGEGRLTLMRSWNRAAD